MHYPRITPRIAACCTLVILLAGCAGQGADPPPQIEVLLTDDPTCSGSITAEPPADLAHTPTPNNKLVGCFAWQTLMALNFPADGGEQPVGHGGEGPTVWESWLSADQVFPHPEAHACDEATEHFPGAPEVLSMVTGLSDELEMSILDQAATEPGPDEASVDRADVSCLDYVLLDRQTKPVWREVALDPTMASFIEQRGLDQQEHVFALDADTFEFPVGSTSVKAAWKVFNPELDSPDEFYVRDVLVDNGETCVPRRVALVALHLAKKTPNFRGWIWMTFEQRSNAPERGRPSELEEPWTFFEPGSEGEPNVPCLEGLVCGPTQLIRLQQVDKRTHAVNDYWWQQLGDESVWRHYALVGTQWLQFRSQQRPHGREKLANVILESACQTLSNGCVHCHSGQSTFDRSFVLARAH